MRNEKIKSLVAAIVLAVIGLLLAPCMFVVLVTNKLWGSFLFWVVFVAMMVGIVLIALAIWQFLKFRKLCKQTEAAGGGSEPEPEPEPEPTPVTRLTYTSLRERVANLNGEFDAVFETLEQVDGDLTEAEDEMARRDARRAANRASLRASRGGGSSTTL